MKKIAALVFMAMVNFCFSADPYRSMKLDINDTESPFKITMYQSETAKIRVFLYQDGEQWIPSTNWIGSFVYGTNGDQSTSLVTITGTVSTVENYIEFACDSTNLNLNGQFYAQVLLSNSNNAIAWQRGKLELKKSPGTTGAVPAYFSANVNASSYNWTGNFTGTAQWQGSIIAPAYLNLSGMLSNGAATVDGYPITNGAVIVTTGGGGGGASAASTNYFRNAANLTNNSAVMVSSWSNDAGYVSRTITNGNASLTYVDNATNTLAGFLNAKDTAISNLAATALQPVSTQGLVNASELVGVAFQNRTNNFTTRPQVNGTNVMIVGDAAAQTNQVYVEQAGYAASVTGPQSNTIASAIQPGVNVAFATNATYATTVTGSQSNTIASALQPATAQTHHSTVDGIVIGGSATNANDGVSIGFGATNTTTRGVSIGYQAIARDGNYNNAIGSGAVVSNDLGLVLQYTTEIGYGQAQTNGYLHYRGTPFVGLGGNMQASNLYVYSTARFTERPTVNGTNVLITGDAAAQTNQVYVEQAGTSQWAVAAGYATSVTGVQSQIVSSVTGFTNAPATWDSTWNTITVSMPDGTSGQMFEENYVVVRNTSGYTITNGKVCAAISGAGLYSGVKLADAADSWINSLAVIGLATMDITNNTTGKITISGNVNDINTTTLEEGSNVWLSATTPGELTMALPTDETKHQPLIGCCLRKNAADGRILVDVQKIPHAHDIGAYTAGSTVVAATNATTVTGSQSNDIVNARIAADAGSNLAYAVGTTQTINTANISGIGSTQALHTAAISGIVNTQEQLFVVLTNGTNQWNASVTNLFLYNADSNWLARTGAVYHVGIRTNYTAGTGGGITVDTNNTFGANQNLAGYSLTNGSFVGNGSGLTNLPGGVGGGILASTNNYFTGSTQTFITAQGSSAIFTNLNIGTNGYDAVSSFAAMPITNAPDPTVINDLTSTVDAGVTNLAWRTRNTTGYWTRQLTDLPRFSDAGGCDWTTTNFVYDNNVRTSSVPYPSFVPTNLVTLDVQLQLKNTSDDKQFTVYPYSSTNGYYMSRATVISSSAMQGAGHYRIPITDTNRQLYYISNATGTNDANLIFNIRILGGLTR